MTIPVYTGELPDPSDRATYGVRGRAFWDYEVNTLIPEINQTAGLINLDKQAAEDSANAAGAMREDKGEWSTLTGALSRPASVTHDGYIWILTIDLADVTAYEPGVSLVWVQYQPSGSATDISFNNAVSGLVANNVQSAIDEIDSGVDALTLTVAANVSAAAADATAKANAAKIQTPGAGVTLSGAAVDFTGIPAGVKRVYLTLNDMSVAGSFAQIVQLGTAGGIVSTGYGGCGTTMNSSAVSTVSYTNGLGISNIATARTLNGEVEIIRHSGNTWVMKAHLSNSQSTDMFISTSRIVLAAQLTQLRLTVNGATTFDGGTANIHWEF